MGSGLSSQIAKQRSLQLKADIAFFLNGGDGQRTPPGFEKLRESLGRGLESDWGNIKIKSLPEVIDVKNLSVSAEEHIAVTIVEPWEHVGHNSLGEEVRASVNVAYLAKAVGLNSRVVPLWKMRCGYPTMSASTLVEGLMQTLCVFEGGYPDVYDASTFHMDTASRDFLWEMYKHVLLARNESSHVCVFICLSHQMVCSTLVELLKDAVFELSRGSIEAQDLSKKIEKIGNKIKVVKTVAGKEETVACSFRDERFATSTNEFPEAAHLNLHDFDPNDLVAHTPELQQCLDFHTNHAQQHTGVYERLAQERKELHGENAKYSVAMFHGNEVNWEAVVFVSWAFDQIAAFRKEHEVAPWLYNLPIGIEITSCTKLDNEQVFPDGGIHPAGSLVTEVASMRLDYRDRDGNIRRSYSCQFHPELPTSLRDARYEKPVGFSELSKLDGQRMLAHFWEQACEDELSRVNQNQQTLNNFLEKYRKQEA